MSEDPDQTSPNGRGRMISVFTVYIHNFLLKFELKNTTKQPLKQKWTGPLDKSRAFHLV